MNERKPVSAVIITLNAERLLDKCLSSVSFCNEIVVVDSGSTDRTLEIARKHGARIIHQEWLGFGPQRQFATEQASYDWILSIDSDEWVSEELQKSIEQYLIAPKNTAVKFCRRNRFMGKWLRHGEGYPDWTARLFNRTSSHWSHDSVHERLCTQGIVDSLKGDLMHESEDGIRRYLDKQIAYSVLSARKLWKRGKRAGATRILLSPLMRFVRFYFLRLGFLDGKEGLVHITIGCIATAIKYIELIELSKPKATYCSRGTE